MNSEYWTQFYKTYVNTEPSKFAVWARPRITGDFVVDLGCGNGRDTLYLEETVDTLGVDPQAPGRLWNFRQTTAEGFMTEYIAVPQDTVYARWFLHAVEQEVEDMLIEWCQGQLLVEARVAGDDQLTDDTHLRRPIDTNRFLSKLLWYRYQINYFEISRDFSYGTPLLFRVDAIRNVGT